MLSSSKINSMGLNKKRSNVWYHYSIILNNIAKCNICYDKISFSGGSTGNLLRHLKTKHPTVLLQRNIQENVSNSDIIDDSQPSKSTNHTPTGQQSFSVATTYPPMFKTQNKHQTSIANFIQKPIPMSKSKIIDQQLVKMIVKEYHPFSIVEDVEFQKLIKMLCPSYIIPSRKTVTQSLMPQLFEVTVESVKDTLKNVAAVCLTTDGWTSRNNQSFISITAHFIDPQDETLISSVLLGCNDFDEKHTGDNLAFFLSNIINEWNLSNKLTVVITDNAANIKAAIRKCNWRWLPCFAHSINLTVQTSLKCIELTITKVKNIVQYFKKNCPTRWNSTYEMINRIVEIKEPIIATLAVLGVQS
ncbi:zinc finger BED domain-containing protein 6-like [Daktulosphaira vitifoliae]|uniref:zinc finger BED domain-containing protein 6-like n=1 Tax=Daktulosphaira vitifoliae TaxID=58002 RepID=UPI0021AA836D|nr:zinc finger BED domain-containing protein 6-like [Daktulosphaira vitifoliae]